MPKLRRVQQLSVFLENRPGQLSLLCDCIAEADVRILAMTVADTVEHGLVRIVVDEPDAADRVIKEGGFNCLRTEALAVELPDTVDALCRVSDSLSRAHVNIQYLYGSRIEPDAAQLMIVRVLDLDRAEEAIRAGSP